MALFALRPAIACDELPLAAWALLDVAVHVVDAIREDVAVPAAWPVIPRFRFMTPANPLVPTIAKRDVRSDAGRRLVHLLVAVAADRHE